MSIYITNTLTREKISCHISTVTARDYSQIKLTFGFDWSIAIKDSKVYKLITGNNEFIHGLIALEEKDDFLFITLIESATVNIGYNKLYDRVVGNLLGFSAKMAMEKYEGYMMTIAKTAMIEHFHEAYGFVRIGSSSRMISYPANTKKLVTSYSDEE